MERARPSAVPRWRCCVSPSRVDEPETLSMSTQAAALSHPVTTGNPLPPLRGIAARLAAPRSRYVLLQSLVGIALSYQLLFGNDLIVSRWVAEVTAAGLLASVAVLLLLPTRVFAAAWFANTVISANTAVTAGVVYAAGQAHGEFYLSYFLLILLAASARSVGQMLGLSAIVCAGYGLLMVEGVVTGGDLSVGRLMGLPVLLMMGLLYGLTLEELGVERRRGELLSHRLAELRVEEERLLMMRDRLLHETTQLKQALSATQQGSPTARVAAVQHMATEVAGRTPHAATARTETAERGIGDRARVERFAAQIGAMLQDVVCVLGREAGALSAGLDRQHALGKHVEQLVMATERTATVATQLQSLAAHDPGHRTPSTLEAVLGELDPTIKEMLPASVTLTYDLHAEGATVDVPSGAIEAAVVALVLHARDAMPEGGRLTIGTQVQERAEGSRPQVALRVIDTGTRLKPEARQGLLDTSLATKTSNGAWGHTVATVEAMVRASGGRLTAAPHAEQSVEVCVSWPCEARSSGGQVRGAIEAALCGRGTETVLVVEEDERVRKWTVVSLRRAHYHVLEARSGVEAMMLAHDHSGSLNLVIANLAMPEIGGVELAERLYVDRAQLRVLFTAHLPEEAMATHRIARRCYLQKPYRQDNLLRKVRTVLDT